MLHHCTLCMCRSVALTVFEIMEFKLKNRNNKNWIKGYFAIAFMLMAQILGIQHYMLTLDNLLQYQNTQSERVFKYTGIMGPKTLFIPLLY